ncbi:MAG: TIR domain-containing protein [Armatimonadetes bacterium]|nr:TIR domain-containing protein [Armatimonadota bacterium]
MRRVFISFDHDDTDQVSGFLGLRNIVENLEFFNHKLDHRINSKNDDYVKRVIREEYIHPASVCVVLIGNNTWRSEWVLWEIGECLRQKMGILGIRLKGSRGRVPDGIPSGHVGGWDPEKFVGWIEWAFQQRGALTEAKR